MLSLQLQLQLHTPTSWKSDRNIGSAVLRLRRG